MVAVGGLVVAAIVTATVDLSTGAVVAAGAVVGAAALASLGDPPPPKGGPSNPAGMNFGR
jgi:ribose/xylose/arabinose/galactoside ABC-type transport system permease subunit